MLVRGVMRPGIQEGDDFDLEVRVTNRDETKSLRGGRLMRTRLTPKAIVQGAVREGRLMAIGEGPVLTDPEVKDDPAALTRGRVLGGGKTLKSHTMGLLLKPDFQNVRYSAVAGASVNQRFHMYLNGAMQTVAKPMNDEYIELKIHPRYKDNVPRYLRVIRALPLRESTADQVTRMAFLERQLLDPITSSTAALRLEAIGKEAGPSLLKGVRSEDPEVRFYAAEALAYLDLDESSEAAKVLGESAREEPAFRVFALTALGSMNNGEAYDQLRQLLSAQGAETRYGAFRALWAMNERDPLVRGEPLAGFSYHTLHVNGPPMVHLTRSFRPEIVIFGHEQEFKTPLVLEAGPEILINAKPNGPVVVSRFVADEPAQQRQVSTKVDDVIRAVVELGGKYPDVAQMLQQAAKSASLPDNCRLAVDAVPQSGRTYTRDDADDTQDGEAEKGSGFVVANPLPNLFPDVKKPSGKARPPRKRHADEDDEGYLSSFFSRIWPEK